MLRCCMASSSSSSSSSESCNLSLFYSIGFLPSQHSPLLLSVLATFALSLSLMHLGFLLSLPHSSLSSIFVLEFSLARFYLCSWARACTTFVKCNICCYPPPLLSLLYSSLSPVIVFHRKKRNKERIEFLKGNTDRESYRVR